MANHIVDRPVNDHKGPRERQRTSRAWKLKINTTKVALTLFNSKKSLVSFPRNVPKDT